jgi:hypothetical protein
MNVAAPRRSLSVLSFVFVLCSMLVTSGLQAQEATIRAKAVLHLSFDEADGPAQDSAVAGTAKDAGQFINGASRVKSPFAGQKGKSALIVEGSKKQFVQVADSADLDRVTGVTLSCFYMHLGSAEEAGFQGLFGKRAEGTTTNYGINFGVKQDLLQVYLNDGTGFKLASFGVQQALGIRRPGFITATYEIGDAPGDDADQDRDDVLVRLFLNGQPLVPKPYAGNITVGNDSWILNVNAAGLVNDVPLTIGSSSPTIEYATGVYDELSLFPQALTPEEALKLFQETAGANATSSVLAETLPPQLPAPVITSLSMNGLQLGSKGNLIITGTNLQPTPIVNLPITGAVLAIGPNSNANQVELLVTVPADALVEHYPVRVQTAGGISNALPLAIDGLPHVPANLSAPDKPLSLPVAVSGALSGAQLVKSYFQGKAGQRIIADVESRRLGAAMTPVVEIKTSQGTPLKIEWGHLEHRGDARAETVLPKDGLYYVELHDLSYAAPGANPFRLKLGDLKLVDSVLGGATVGVDAHLGLSGQGIVPQVKLDVKAADLAVVAPRNLPLPAALGVAAPAPNLIVSRGVEVVEVVEKTPAGGQQQSVEAKFATNPPQPVYFTGAISQPRERDVIVFQVTPGQRLNFLVSGVAVDSPLDPQFQILKHPEGTVLAGAENPGAREAGLEYVVAADQQQIQLAVKDLRARGGANFRYRVRVVPAGQPDFSLTVSSDRLQLPQDGSAVAQLDVNRVGYNGVIKLSLLGDAQLSISPTEIPAGINKTWITLTRQGAAVPVGTFSGVQIVGDASELTPVQRSVATVPADARLILLPSDRTLVAGGLTGPIQAALELGALPAAIYRGADLTLPLQLKVAEQGKAKTARLTLMSTEVPRQNNPADPNQGQKPRVDGGINQTVEAGSSAEGLKITVPLDIADANIDFVIKAELVEHPFAQNVFATTYSKPFRLPVQNALAAVQPAANNLALVSATPFKLTGTIKRTAGFAGPVSVQIANLPAGSTVNTIVVPAGQEAFELTVTPPAVTAVTDVANVVLRLVSENGKTLHADVALPTKIMPQM